MSVFQPHQPEKQVKVKIFKREAVLLKRLRKYPYGKILVHKMEGKITRIEPTDSQLIEEDEDTSDLESL